MTSKFCEYFTKLWRTKPTDSVTSDTNLKRCLGLFNLLVIGIGAMIGSGIYVMSGFAIRDQAGPSTVLSFLLAAVIILLIAACYTELASKLHKTGSTYLYIYLTIGEFPAFITGLSIMIMICLGGAVNARAWSFYLDSLCNGVISNFTMEHIAEWNIGPPIAKYPDILAFVMLVILTLVVALGADFSAKFSTFFVFVNISVLSLVTVCGFIFGDLENWTGGESLRDPKNSTDDEVSGFFPYGFRGTVQATAMCFWAFSGFELISCMVEETKNPKRNIPIATGIVMLIVTCLYISTTAALSLMVPYHSLSTTTPLATVFVSIGQNWGSYVVSVGTLCAFTTTMLSTFYSFVRIGLAMAEDGLLFPLFARVNKRTKVPVISAVFCGCTEALIALFLDIQNLISFTVNLILLSYCAVCAGVIIISYRPPKNVVVTREVDEEYVPVRAVVEGYESVKTTDAGYLQLESKDPYSIVTIVNGKPNDDVNGASDVKEVTTSFQDAQAPDQGVVQSEREQHTDAFNGDPNLKSQSDPDIYSSTENIQSLAVESHEMETRFLRRAFVFLKPCIVCRNGRCALFALGMMSLFMLGLSFCITYAIQPLEHGTWWSIVLFCLAVFGIVVFFTIICIHRQTAKQVVLKLNCVPLVPATAIVMCLMLLVANSTQSSWIGCSILLTFATLVYLSYSIRHSRLNLEGIRASETNNRLLSEAVDSD